MANENGTWIMKGLSWDDPYRIRTWQELVNWVDEIGFLPLFANDITGFSVTPHRITGGLVIRSKIRGNGVRLSLQAMR